MSIKQGDSIFQIILLVNEEHAVKENFALLLCQDGEAVMVHDSYLLGGEGLTFIFNNQLKNFNL